MLIFAKIIITFTTVFGLAKVAEVLGPRHAGLLAGFPLGTAIALYFFSYQQGPQFAATSATYTLAGLTSALCLAAGYQFVIARKKRLRWLPVAVGCALLCFFAAAAILQFLPANRWLSLLVIALSMLLFRRLFRPIKEKTKAKPVSEKKLKSAAWLKRPGVVLLLRASIATATILFITGVAELLGPTRAGLLAAFPISFFPLLVIMHISYGAKVLSTSIKHYPDGIGALVVYCLAVSFIYPHVGHNLGTLLSLGCSLGYLLLYSWLYHLNQQRSQPA